MRPGRQHLHHGPEGTGILVFDDAGRQLGTLELPEKPANLNWGGPTWSDLYICAADLALPVFAQDRRGALFLHGGGRTGGQQVTLGRLGAWCSIGSSYVVEVLGSCGFDWICIDLQHGFAGVESLLPMVQAAAITQTPALVRVPRLDAGMIGRALDAGAAGVIVPMVNSAAEARAAVAACRYPPDGIRSWGPARLMLGRPRVQRPAGQRPGALPGHGGDPRRGAEPRRDRPA